MKTFKQTIEKPRLEIRPDELAENPRHFSNLGYFLTKDSKHISPDEWQAPQIQEIMVETAKRVENQEEHIEQMAKQIREETDEEVVAIYPIAKYEHSGVTYKLGNFSGFDHSQNGFYIITEQSRKKITEKDFEQTIKAELEEYNKWANRETWEFVLYDENGRFEDQKGGYYYYEDIRADLPEEWKNERLEDYISLD